MFVTTRLKSPHFPSNLLRHMCVINFSITKLQVAPASSHEPRFSPKLQCLGVLCGSALGSLQATYNWTHPQHAAKSMVHIHSIQEYGAHSLNSRVWCTFTQFKSTSPPLWRRGQHIRSYATHQHDCSMDMHLRVCCHMGDLAINMEPRIKSKPTHTRTHMHTQARAHMGDLAINMEPRIKSKPTHTRTHMHTQARAHEHTHTYICICAACVCVPFRWPAAPRAAHHHHTEARDARAGAGAWHPH